MRRIYHALLFATGSLLGGLALSGVAQAADGQINVTGNIVANTCNISIDDRNKTVNMGTVSSKQFLHGSTTAFPKEFTLSLVDCGPAAEGMTIGFHGAQDANRHDLLALDSDSAGASGIGIALLDANKAPIPINTQTSTYPLQANTDLMVLHFFAQYTANGASVAAGKANATATFDFIYD
ncbi:fimbrial protein [Klebsiella aerogenes]|uniref:fimbrial protein n=1 Tax=Klebsiella aerogenes TaxID=548 RepID=UPI0021D13984|nr:fimbrial protein [Klebsiella aerogenes]MCU6317027.1 fimbrial protein [Klebsiella aerogenes]